MCGIAGIASTDSRPGYLSVTKKIRQPRRLVEGDERLHTFWRVALKDYRFGENLHAVPDGLEAPDETDNIC